MLDGQRPKQRRAPRKPYCRQCKERKVKCDMLQPNCKRCTRRDRACIYDDFPTSLAQSGTNVDRETNSVYGMPESSELGVQELYRPDELAASMMRSHLGGDHMGTILRSSHDSETDEDALDMLRMRVKMHSYQDVATMAKMPARPSSRPSLEVMYTSAFASRIHSTSTFFARPREWLDILKLEDDALVNASVRACGALYVGHETQASVYYCQCLGQLRKLSATATLNVSSVLKICLVVMFLFIYETEVPGGNMNAFQTHFNGLANLLQELVAVTRNSSALPNMSEAQRTISHLLVAEFRRIECVRIAFLRIAPSISAEAYDILLPYHHLFEENWNDDKLMWSTHYLTGLVYEQDDKTKALVLAQVEQNLLAASWAGKSLQSSVFASTNAFVSADTQPFSSCLFVAESSAPATRTASSYYMYCDVAILRLQMTMHSHSMAERISIINRADRCAQLTLFLLTFEHRGSSSWLALALLALFETYSLICSPNDDRIAWSRRLVQNIKSHVNSGIAMLLEYEVTCIDAGNQQQSSFNYPS